MKGSTCPIRLITATIAALIIAGCGGAQTPISPSSSGSNVPGRVVPLDASTQVDIRNDWTASIAGSGSATCWTISPALPLVGAGDTAGPITLTHHTSPSCGIPSGLTVTYGPAASTGARCMFNVVYDVSFSFSVTQSSSTNCSIEYPPTINAIFVYARLGSAMKHSPIHRSH